MTPSHRYGSWIKKLNFYNEENYNFERISTCVYDLADQFSENLSKSPLNDEYIN